MEIFTTTGHSLLDPGYTTILTWQALGSNDTLPKFTSEEKANIQEVKNNTFVHIKHLPINFSFCRYCRQNCSNVIRNHPII